MVRIAKLTDYGIVVLTHFVDGPAVQNARDLAERTHLGLPTVSKLLKLLAKAGILASVRGKHGGYSLARSAESISMASILAALEGNLALTECGGENHGICSHEQLCPARPTWRRINDVVLQALQGLSLVEMAKPHGTLPRAPLASVTTLPVLDQQGQQKEWL